MIDDVVSGDTRGSLRPMLLGVVPEVDQGRLPASHQHRADALETAANLGEEFVLRADFGAVLSRRMHVCLHRTRLDGTRIDLQNVRLMVVDPDNGVGCRGEWCVHERISDAFAVNSANAVIALALYINEGPPPM